MPSSARTASSNVSVAPVRAVTEHAGQYLGLEFMKYELPIAAIKTPAGSTSSPAPRETPSMLTFITGASIVVTCAVAVTTT